jgi:hypothetical protein
LFSKIVVLTAFAMTFASLDGLAASKEIVRLQADMTLLQQQVRDLQKSFDTQNAVLQKLVEQLTDQVNILKRSVEDVKGSNQQTQAAVSARVESVVGQFSAVNSSLTRAGSNRRCRSSWPKRRRRSKCSTRPRPRARRRAPTSSPRVVQWLETSSRAVTI